MISANDVRRLLNEFHRVATEAAFASETSQQAAAKQWLPNTLQQIRDLARRSQHLSWCAELIDQLEHAESVAWGLDEQTVLGSLLSCVASPDLLRQQLDSFRQDIQAFPSSEQPEYDSGDWIVPQLVQLEVDLRFFAECEDESSRKKTPGCRHQMAAFVGYAFFGAAQRGAFKNVEMLQDPLPLMTDADASDFGFRLMVNWVNGGKCPNGWTVSNGLRELAEAVHQERLRLMPARKPDAKFLDLTVDREERKVWRRGCVRPVELNGQAAVWHIFIKMFEAGQTGTTRDDVLNGYPADADHLKHVRPRLNTELIPLSIAIEPRKWRLVSTKVV